MISIIRLNLSRSTTYDIVAVVMSHTVQHLRQRAVIGETTIPLIIPGVIAYIDGE